MSYSEKSFSYFKVDRVEMLSFVPEDATKILEVGCGAGNFAYALKKRNNAEVWGIEPFRDAAILAEPLLNKVIFKGIDDSIVDLPNDYFDCIVFNDVLEHLEYPWLILDMIKPKLKNGGAITSSIPNVRYISNLVKLLIKSDWKYTESGILDKTHLRFFTEKSIRRMFNELNLKIEVIEGINPSHRKIVTTLIDFFSFNQLADIKYLQFAVLARKFE